MCRLVETLKIADGIICQLPYHSDRMNRSRQQLFGCTDTIDIANILTGKIPAGQGVYKCRIVYDRHIHGIDIQPYTRKKVESLRCVYDNTIRYEYKHEDRQALQKLYEHRQSCDDILIIKNNLITDTSYSNIAFFDGNNWLTPAHPLLKGTRRAQLLTEGKIQEAILQTTDLQQFAKASLINAMMDLDEMVVNIKNIVI